MKLRVRKATKKDSGGFLRLLVALAEFEKLRPPDDSAKRRILDDVFKRRRVRLFVASKEGELVGYALYFFSYSSFLAKPTLYLEDLFVLKEHRGSGIGLALFLKCVEEAESSGCGRMEWSVLTWNRGAIEFYEKLGARRLDEWAVYRLDERAISSLRGSQPNI